MSNHVITISGKTCSGKTFLLNQLLETGLFNKLVTSTTRHPREGEKSGEDYHFIQSSLAEHYIEKGSFLEYNLYGNQVYGLTKNELISKLGEGKVPCVILTPNGVEAYRKFLAEEFGLTVVSIFIDCPQDLLVDRLVARVLKEPVIDEKVLKVNIDRAISVSLNEQHWRNYLDWDLIVSAKSDGVFDKVIKFTKQFSNT
jgi:guanylate kinase